MVKQKRVLARDRCLFCGRHFPLFAVGRSCIFGSIAVCTSTVRHVSHHEMTIDTLMDGSLELRHQLNQSLIMSARTCCRGTDDVSMCMHV